MSRTVAQSLEAFNGSPYRAILQSRYGEPWRHYHVWAHPVALIAHLLKAEADGVHVHDPDACVIFDKWHDAYYDPQATHGRNEELSALLCEQEAAHIFRPKSVAHAARAIRASATHQAPSPVECPDAQLLLDIDLSIFGASPTAFDAYDTAIRAEYAHVEESDYRARRAKILGGFLARPRIYLTDWAHEKWNVAARINLQRTIDRLRASPMPSINSARTVLDGVAQSLA